MSTDPSQVPGDAPAVDPAVAPELQPVDSAGNPIPAPSAPTFDLEPTPVPVINVDLTTGAAVPGDAPVADVPADAPVPPAAPTEVVVDGIPTVVVDPVPASDPSNVSATDPTADPIVPVVAEAQPDTPPTDNPDVYAQNLAANVAGSPVTQSPVVQSDDVDPRYALRTEQQLSDLEAASALLLNAVRALCVAGLTRGQLRDSCVLAIDQLYVERNDAQASGSDDPYPSY